MPAANSGLVRPTVATVRLDAIQANVRAIRRVLETTRTAEGQAAVTPPGLIAVIKANAYGHGAIQVAKAIEQAGASMLACADIEEGVALRDAGVTLPILVFGALSVSDLAGVFDRRLTPTISTPGAARALERASADRGVRLGCHLKIDTGMNRLGFRHDNLRKTMPEVLASQHLSIDAVYTHMATADDPESPFLDEQHARFERACAALGAMGLTRVKRHAANSATLLRDARAWYDWVRPGLLLYGIVPPPLAAADLDLRPALSLTSRMVAVKGVRAGEGVGYGLRWRTDEPRSIGDRPRGIRRRARHATVGARLGAGAWPPCANRRRGLDGHDRRRRHRTRRRAGRRGRDHRPAGRRRDHRARDGGGDRVDSLGSRLPPRRPRGTEVRRLT